MVVCAKFHNVLVNAISAMLIYSGHFGSCAIAPIVLESMQGIGGIDEHLLFLGMAVSSLFSVVLCPFITPAIDKLGTKVCLVLGGMLITALAPSLFYPVPGIFLTSQACNGVGCALLRAASLKFLTDNSPPDKLAQYNGIHWSIFMGCILVGNCVLLIATGSGHNVVDSDMRLRICISLTSLGVVGIILYIFFLRKVQTHEAVNETSLLISRKKLNSSTSTIGSEPCSLETSVVMSERRYVPIFLETPITQPEEETVEEEQKSGNEGFWGSTRHLKRWSTLNLLVGMLNCAVFPCLFTTLGPLFVGQLLEDKRFVGLFGICAGLGEITGSLIAGRVISGLGVKKSVVFVTLVGLVGVGLSGLLFPQLPGGSPLVRAQPSIFCLLGILLGMGDASNGVLLSTLIGEIYREYSQAGFALYSCIFNIGAIGLYIISSYFYFSVTLWVMFTVVVSTLVAILLLRNSVLPK